MAGGNITVTGQEDGSESENSDNEDGEFDDELMIFSPQDNDEEEEDDEDNS